VNQTESQAPSSEDAVPEKILRAASEAFAARGYHGTSIQEVAEAAGITRPTLIYHFHSKEGLRDAVLERVLQHWSEELPRMLAAARQGPRLDALLGALTGFFSTQPALARLVLREALDRPERLRERLRVHLQPWTGLLVDAIRMGQQGGWLKAVVDPESFVVLVVANTVGMVAVGEAASALVPGEPSLEAQEVELGRIARSALLGEGL